MRCSICGGEVKQVIDYKDFPIYQHPVLEEIKAKIIRENPNVLTNLNYNTCVICGHSRIDSAIDTSVLEEIYTDYYNYPSVLESGVGGDQANYLVDLLIEKEDIANKSHIVEIGGYDGYLLSRIKPYINTSNNLLLIEPNKRGAAIACKYNIKVINDFFAKDTLDYNSVDILLSRHVIEHIEDLDSFCSALSQILKNDGLLVLETPCGDYHMEKGTIEPFHPEHVHVFTLKSLELALRKHDLYVSWADINPYGNLIICAKKRRAEILPEITSDYRKLIDITKLKNNQADLRFKKWLSKINSAESIVIWGAGSYGATLFSIYSIQKERISFFVDIDSFKQGLKFVHLDQQIMIPQIIFESDINNVIVASTYSNEIIGQLNKMTKRVNVFSIWDNLRNVE